jgi:molecular chaperone HscB
MTLEVDRDAVDAAFRQRSREVHPDRLARADPRERRLAAERTASLNTAYAALRSVETRAAWLLRRAGVQVERTTDPDLLNDVMELRERALEDPGPVRQLAQAARTRALDRVVAAYRTLEGAGTALDPRALEPLARDLNAARYYARLLDDLSGSGRASP